MHVPESPTGLDAAWLQAALAESEAFADVRIDAVEARRIGVGYGLDGTVVRLGLETAGGAGAPSSLVAKLTHGRRGRDEIAFYERIAPLMPVRLPVCFACHLSADGERAVLLLEDLTDAVQGDCIAGADRAQAEAVFAAAGRYHGRFHGGTDPALAGLSRWSWRAEKLATELEERIPRFVQRYGQRVGRRAVALASGLPERLPGLVRVLEDGTPTLVHTDLHLDNVMFAPDGEPVILDWPDARVGPPILDVVRLFVEGTSVAVRRAHRDALLEIHGRARAAHGAPPLPPGETGAGYEAAVLWHLAYVASWGGAEQPGFETPRVRGIVDSLMRNTAAAALDL